MICNTNLSSHINTTQNQNCIELIELGNHLNDKDYHANIIKNIYKELYSVVWLKQELNSRPASCIITVSKLTAIAASYLASYPFIRPAEAVTQRFILQKCFAAGEFIAWGTLSAWSACTLIDRIASKFSLKREMCGQALYWVPLFALGMLSEIPSAYISYEYNNNIFWTLYTPLIYSFYDVQSMDALAQKIVHSDSNIIRYLHCETSKTTNFKAKKVFLKILENCISDFIKFPNHPLKNKLIEIFCSKTIKKKDACTRALIEILRLGLEIQIKQIMHQPVYIKRGSQIVQLVGCAASLVTSGVDGYLVYLGGKLLFDNDIIILMMVILAVAPSAYLDIDINRNTYSNLFRSLTSSNFKKDCKEKFINRLGYLLASIITIFGLGSLTTVLEDTFELEEWWSVVLFAIVTTSSGILAINALGDFSDFTIKKLHSLKREEELVKFDERLKVLIEYFDSMPMESFEEFLKELKNLGIDLNKLDDKNYIEQILSSSSGCVLDDSICSIKTQSEEIVFQKEQSVMLPPSASSG